MSYLAPGDILEVRAKVRCEPCGGTGKCLWEKGNEVGCSTCGDTGYVVGWVATKDLARDVARLIGEGFQP